MTTEATASQARKHPPAPSERTSNSRQTSVRPARRTSNRPSPFEQAQRAAPVTRVNQTTNSKPVTRPAVASTSASAQSPSIQAGVTRDDVVRALMPELQVLLRHLVDTGIDRALAPLLEKQRELESTIKELRNAQARPAPALAVAAPHDPATRSVQTKPEAAVARPAQLVVADAVTRPATTAVAAHAPGLQRQVSATATFDTTPLLDIPPELNGARRKKAILWVLGVAVLLTLAAAVVLSVLSNQGTYL